MGIYLQSLLTRLFVFNILVNFGWTEALLGTPKFAYRISWHLLHALFNDKMRRLVMIVISARFCQVCEQIESKHTVVLRILNRLKVFCFASCGRVWCRMSKGPWFFAFGNVLSETAVDHSCPQTLVKSAFKIATGSEFFSYPRRAHFSFVKCQLISRNFTSSTILFPLGLIGVHDGLCGKHSCLHRIMGALNLSHVQKTCRTASKHSSFES